MLRLPVLLLTTVAGIFAVMVIWGDGDLRSARRPAPEPVPEVVAAEPEPVPVPLSEPISEPVAEPLPEPVAEPVVAAEDEPAIAETAGGIERFAGPALEVSPEFADAARSADVQPGEPSLWVTASRLNMRSGPGSGNAVVAGLDGGTALVPLGPADADWVEVRAPSGQTGFVSSQFVTSTPPE